MAAFIRSVLSQVKLEVARVLSRTVIEGICRELNYSWRQCTLDPTTTVHAYGYDNDDRLTSLSHDKGGTNLASYTWSFDYAGRLTGTTSADGSTSYTYDAAGQLTAADHSYQTDEAYSYDANGNRTNSGYSTGACPPPSRPGTGRCPSFNMLIGRIRSRWRGYPRDSAGVMKDLRVGVIG